MNRTPFRSRMKPASGLHSKKEVALLGTRLCFPGILIASLATVVLAQSAPIKKDIPTIARSAREAIVTIVMANNDEPLSAGTGFLVSRDGVIVTNYHVIRSGNAGLVKFADDTIIPVDGVLAANKVRDIAIIKIHGKTFRTLTLGNSNRVQVGDDVVAIGNPHLLEQTVSNGILSGVRTDTEAAGRLLQITAPITHGSSGGPLFNMMGEVIGITTEGFEGSGNLNFAIPINDAKNLLLNKSGKLQNLPDEPLAQVAETAKGVVPGNQPEQRWLSSERYSNSDFSALYPRGKAGDSAVSCSTHQLMNICEKVTENGNVQSVVSYADLPPSQNLTLGESVNEDFLKALIANPVILSTSSASINQDQSFTQMSPIKAREVAAKGIYEGDRYIRQAVPAKLCMRAGMQGRRIWVLSVLLSDSTSHTQKECDAFFDSVIVK